MIYIPSKTAQAVGLPIHSKLAAALYLYLYKNFLEDWISPEHSTSPLDLSLPRLAVRIEGRGGLQGFNTGV
jgi:hypothetical protein